MECGLLQGKKKNSPLCPPVITIMFYLTGRVRFLKNAGFLKNQINHFWKKNLSEGPFAVNLDYCYIIN